MEDFKDVQQATEELASYSSDVLRAALAARGRAAIALSGGSTPRHYLPAIFDLDLDWSQIVIGLVDDRYVPPDHTDSNERLVRSLLSEAPAARSRFLSLWRGLEAAERDARAASQEAVDLALEFDIAFLGMGDDGHTASLFPGQRFVERSGDKWVRADPSPQAKPQHTRITMTPAALMACGHACLVFSGSQKKKIWANVTSFDSPKKYPVRLLKQHPNLTVYVLP